MRQWVFRDVGETDFSIAKGVISVLSGYICLTYKPLCSERWPTTRRQPNPVYTTPIAVTLLFHAAKYTNTFSLASWIINMPRQGRRTHSSTTDDGDTELVMRMIELETTVNHLEQQLDAHEQYSRRPNLRVQGIPEDGRGEDVESKVLSVVNEKMGFDPPLIPTDLERSHRLGRVVSGQKRPVPSLCGSSRSECATRSIAPEAR